MCDDEESRIVNGACVVEWYRPFPFRIKVFDSFLQPRRGNGSARDMLSKLMSCKPRRLSFSKSYVLSKLKLMSCEPCMLSLSKSAVGNTHLISNYTGRLVSPGMHQKHELR